MKHPSPGRGRFLCVVVAVLVAISLGLALGASGAQATAPRLVYVYDGGEAPVRVADSAMAARAPDQDIGGWRRSMFESTHGYDDPPNLERASARPGGDRMAPNTTQVLTNQRIGNAAADAIASRYPGALREVTHQAESGARRLDVLTPQGLAIESKVGRTSLTSATRQQIARDVELLNDPFSPVNAIEWHFGVSPITGRFGPTAPLLEALEKAGINVVM